MGCPPGRKPGRKTRLPLLVANQGLHRTNRQPTRRELTRLCDEDPDWGWRLSYPAMTRLTDFSTNYRPFLAPLTARIRWYVRLPSGLTRAERRAARHRIEDAERTLVGARVDLAWLTATRNGLATDLGNDPDWANTHITIDALDTRITDATRAVEHAMARRDRLRGLSAAGFRTELGMGGTSVGGPLVNRARRTHRLEHDLAYHLDQNLGLRAEALAADTHTTTIPIDSVADERNHP